MSGSEITRLVAFVLLLEVLAGLPFITWIQGSSARNAWWMVVGVEIILVTSVARVLLNRSDPTIIERAPLIIAGCAFINVYFVMVLYQNRQHPTKGREFRVKRGQRGG